jgi:phloretin hydrolase
MSGTHLGDYLDRPLTTAEPELIAEIERGPIDPAQAMPLSEVDRLLNPAPLGCETGWCWLPDGVGYVAVRTQMPAVTGEMLDWWFDWHADDPLRYRIWHPRAHKANRIERPARTSRAKAHWGAVHHPVEDVGTGVAHARIAFLAPSEMGMSSDALDDPRVATIVCGYAGDDTRRVRHTPMFHVVLTEAGGVVMRSRFWLGAALRPYGPLGGLGEPLLNNRLVRRAALPRALPHALATHCAEEYANLAALLPELWRRFGQPR